MITDFVSRKRRLYGNRLPDVSALICYVFSMLAVALMVAETVYAITN